MICIGINLKLQNKSSLIDTHRQKIKEAATAASFTYNKLIKNEELYV